MSEKATPQEIAEARRITDSDFINIDDDALVSRDEDAEVVWVQGWIRITE